MPYLIDEILFWIHLFLIFGLIIVAYFLPQLAIFITILHQLHIMYFGDCIFSVFQRFIQAMPADADFISFAVLRFTNQQITQLCSYWINKGIIILVFALSLMRL